MNVLDYIDRIHISEPDVPFSGKTRLQIVWSDKNNVKNTTGPDFVVYNIFVGRVYNLILAGKAITIFGLKNYDACSECKYVQYDRKLFSHFNLSLEDAERQIFDIEK